MSEFSVKSVTGGKLCMHFLPLGRKILSMLKNHEVCGTKHDIPPVSGRWFLTNY
ncbi:hypothetical protein J4227_01860 [Candidatus Woesearchaeota archaeon]|nr:hypothetical protein [Candidatus Woesearchaeota archaeon]